MYIKLKKCDSALIWRFFVKNKNNETKELEEERKREERKVSCLECASLQAVYNMARVNDGWGSQKILVA